MPLPLVVGAVADDDAHAGAGVGVGHDVDGRVLAGPVHRRAVEPHREPDPEQGSGAACAPGALLGAQPVVVERCECRVEARLVVPRVVDQAHCARERERVGGHEVATPQLDRVHRELDRGDVDQALEQRARLRPSGTAVRAHRRRVGHRAAPASSGPLEPVGARRHHDGRVRDERADDRVRARVTEHVDPEPDERAVATQAERAALHLPASVRHTDQVLAAGLRPRDRAPEPACELGHHHGFGRGLELAAESAAHLRGAHANFVVAQAERVGDRIADLVHPLRRRPHREHPGVVVDAREHAVGLHRRRRHPLVHEVAADDELRAEQHGRFLVVDPLERDVGAVLGERDQRVRLERGDGIDGDGQRLEAHVDELRGVECVSTRVGDHDRDGITHEPHGVDGQRRAIEHRWEHRVWAHRADPEIGRSEYGHDTGCRARGRTVDRSDAGVRER